MVRIKRGNIARKRRKQILKLAKGFKGAHSSLFRVAKQQVFKALKYSYRGRKEAKRSYRRLWITRINAVTRYHNINYSKFMFLLKISKIGLNRKILSQIIALDYNAFEQLLSVVI